MQPLEIEILLEEVQGAVGVVQSQLEARGKTNYEWWQKARQALGYIVEKRNLLRSLVKDHKRIKESVSKQRRREWRSARYAALNAIRERLGSEETEKVVGDLIELIMEDYAPKEPRPS